MRVIGGGGSGLVGILPPCRLASPHNFQRERGWGLLVGWGGMVGILSPCRLASPLNIPHWWVDKMMH